MTCAKISGAGSARILRGTSEALRTATLTWPWSGDTKVAKGCTFGPEQTDQFRILPCVRLPADAWAGPVGVCAVWSCARALLRPPSAGCSRLAEELSAQPLVRGFDAKLLPRSHTRKQCHKHHPPCSGLSRIHLVATHLLPFLTGHPPCKLWLSNSPFGRIDQNSTASPDRGLYRYPLSHVLKV